MVILDSGTIAAEGTPAALKDTYAGDTVRLYGADPAALEKKGLAFTAGSGYLELTVPSTAAARALIVQYPDLFDDFEVVKGRMDDVFLAVTGKQLKEG